MSFHSTSIEDISTINLVRIARVKPARVDTGWQIQEIDHILEIIIERLEKDRLDSLRESYPYPAGIGGVTSKD